MSAIPLRQSTAGQVFRLGPMISDSDGKTVRNDLSIAAADVQIYKGNAATSPVAKNSGGLTAVNASTGRGMYHGTFDATDTSAVGRMEAVVAVSGALPKKQEFVVYPANVFDYMTGADLLQVDVREIIGDAYAAQRMADAFASMGYFTVQADAGNSNTQVKTNLSETVNLFWSGAQVIMISGALAKHRSKAVSYNGTTKILTFDPLVGTPSVGDIGLLV